MTSPPAENTTRIEHFDFLLVDGFSSLSFYSAVETLQNANLVAGCQTFSWRTVGVSGESVASSSGLVQRADCTLSELNPGLNVVLVSGEDAYNIDITKLKIWFAKHIRANVRLISLGTAAIIVGRAGLLKNCEASIHPWYRTGFSEEFIDVTLSNRTHVSNGVRCSASGGTSSIDLFLDFVEQSQGGEFAGMVADSMCYRQTRLLQSSIDIGKPHSTSILHPIVSRAVSKMEENLEFPKPPSDLATELSISTRQLERLFKRYIGRSPKRHYMRIRLHEAYRLLLQTQLDITQVGLATGFSSPSHFSKCFRAEFGVTPYNFRKGVSG